MERDAQATDAALLIDCTLRGPCGQRAAECAAHRNCIQSWNAAMVHTARSFSPEKVAELLAWEDEHLGGRAVGPDGEPFGTNDWPGWSPLIGSPPWQESRDAKDPDPGPVPVPSLDNGVPVDVLRPTLYRKDLSAGACGMWAMLVSYYWSCEDNRNVTQLHEHRPHDIAETDELLTELTIAGMITVFASGMVAINPDHLGVLAPPQT